MIDAIEELNDFQIVNSYEDYETVEMVIYLYLAVRLKPLLKKAQVNAHNLNLICETLANNYIEEDISLDSMINAVYNYINSTQLCPSVHQLNITNIEKFLEDNYDK